MSETPRVVVGLGASAGGLEAFRAFFEHTPARTGMAFVLVQHLDPTHESYLPELLAKHAKLPVTHARDGETVAADHVYVIPPDNLLRISGGRLRLTPREGRRHRTPIDTFFRSLADDQKDEAICVILSGTGSDGTLGLRAVKEHGGLVVVEADSARYDGMPKSALATGLADAVLPVEQIPGRLVEYAEHLAQVRESGGDARAARSARDHLPEVCKLLLDRTGTDFRQYKATAVIRRLLRRVPLARARSVPDYVELLRSEPREVDLLFKDLLISVTRFFRDPAAFEALGRELLPPLFRAKEPGEHLRVWIPGCASGEEAYSVAMLLDEQADRLEDPPDITIFATDLDDRALDIARQGRYPETIAEDVGSERLARYFDPSGSGYQVARRIREMCIFSRHDVTRDPPFSRLDLIACRNLLIYLEPELQEKLTTLFHYALLPGGALFLGSSEVLGGPSGLFEPVVGRYRLYRRSEAGQRPPLALPFARQAGLFVTPGERRRSRRGASVGSMVERLLLDEFAPPCALVNARHEVLHFSGKTGSFLEPPSGAPTYNLVDLARPSLRMELRAALHQAFASGEEVVREGVPVQAGRDVQRLDLILRPVRDLGEEGGHCLVVFRPVGSPISRDEAAKGGAAPREDSLTIRELELELRTTREQLSTTIEELKSSNEELLSMNEELQSANEQLQTSQEELQSTNEEVQTVNAELKQKIRELRQANGDLQNLLQSTRIATVFLDDALKVKSYTPDALKIYPLIEADVGRPITDIADPFQEGDLLGAMRQVLADQQPRELQLQLRETERWFIARILPYLTVDHVPDGLVLTFVDVTEIKRAERAQRESEELTQRIVESSRDCIMVLDLDGRISTINSAGTELLEAPVAELVGHDWLEQWSGSDRELVREAIARGARGEAAQFEASGRSSAGAPRWWEVVVSPIRDGGNRPGRLLAIARDVSQRKEAEEALRRSEAEFRAIADAVPQMVWRSDPGGDVGYFNRRWREFAGQSLDHDGSWRWDLVVYPRDLDGFLDAYRGALAAGEGTFEREVRLRRADGAYRWHLARAVPVTTGAGGHIAHWFGTCTDIQDQKQAQEALETADRQKNEFLAMLAHELRNPLAPIRNALHLLEHAPADATQGEKLRQIMTRQIEHLSRMIEDLLDASRISRGKIELRRRRLDLRQVVEEALEGCVLLREREHRIDVDLPDEPLPVEADHDRLGQVVGNLLHNAAKYTPAGGHVQVRLGREDAQAVLRIIDDGGGIPPDLLPSIFDLFTQGRRSLERSEGGLGVGLTMVRHLVELHGGSVAARSGGLDQGSEFRVALPLAWGDVEPVAPEPARRAPESVAADGGRSRLRVLIVEDNGDAAESLAEIVGHDGHVVEVVRDGRSALDVAQEFVPDAVVLDIGLPGMDGIEVGRRLRAHPQTRGALLVALTGYGQAEDRRASKEAGFDHHLVKPADPEALLGLLERAARRAHPT